MALTVLVEETAADLGILRVVGRQRQLLRLGKLLRISDHAGGRSGAQGGEGFWSALR